MHDVTDVVTASQFAHGVAVGDVEGLDGNAAIEKRRDVGALVSSDDDLPARSARARAVWAPIIPRPPVTRIIAAPRSAGG